LTAAVPQRCLVSYGQAETDDELFNYNECVATPESHSDIIDGVYSAVRQATVKRLLDEL
jgi:hypothetical protein